MRSLAVLFLASILASSALAAAAPEVLIVGTFHLDNPGLDYLKSDVPDVLSPERQKEVAAIVRNLERFRPNKVVVEWPASRQAELDAKYAAYRAGKSEPSRSERSQIGFRLANELGLSSVYAIDVAADMDLDAVMEYAKKHDPEFLAVFDDVMKNLFGIQAKMQTEKPIGETLRWINDPDILARSHRVYLQMAEVGAGESYIGAEQTGGWYVRNVKIFANLLRLAQPGDRIVVIYGAGHAPILRQLASEAGMKVVDAPPYL